jgi:hypothetical protein
MLHSVSFPSVYIMGCQSQAEKFGTPQVQLQDYFIVQWNFLALYEELDTHILY